LCIGQSAPSAQHAIRASGPGIQPAQIAAFPAIRPNVSARAARRWNGLVTALECSTPETLSNQAALKAFSVSGLFAPPVEASVVADEFT